MVLKERIDRSVIIILVKINHSSQAFPHYGSGTDTSCSKIRNVYKNTLASKYSILLLIPSCTPELELGLLARDCETGKFVFSYLLACLIRESQVTCDLHETTFITTTEETK